MKYKVAEFRENIREALNRVDEGEEVAIVRYGEEYLIKKKGEKPAVRREAVYTPEKREQVMNVIEVQGECKNGHLLQPGRNRCSMKGCKYEN